MITIYNIRPKGFNVGNDAIAIGLRQYLYKSFGSVVNIVTVPATARYESSNYAGLTPKLIYDMNQYADGVIIGGGNLYENGELDVSLDALDALNVPMMLFSISWGRVYNKIGKLTRRTDTMPDRVLRALHEKAFISLARDNSTYSYLKSIDCPNVVLGGCPTVFLDRVEQQLPCLPETQTGAFISIRNPQLMNIPPADQARVHGDILGLIKLLQERGFNKVRLLCHDHRDINFAASFPGVDFVYTSDVYDYLALLKSCELNISYRLHACLPCLAYDTPTVKITYDERAASLMETIDCEDISVNMMQVSDVVAAVANKLSTITSQQIKQKAQTRWLELDKIMESGFKSFASEVLKYREAQKGN